MKWIILFTSILLFSNVLANEGDRLEQLSETLANGAYTHPDEVDFPPISNSQVKLRDKTIELSNDEIEEKYRAIARRYVNSSSLNVRDKPDGAVIDQLKHGQSVFIYDVSGDWERISKETESPKWVDSRLLCSTEGCYKGVAGNATSSRLSTYRYTPTTYTSSGGRSVYVKGHFRKNGSYVRPHTRSKARR